MHKITHKGVFGAALFGAAMIALPTPALAQEAGDFQFKVLGTGVLPNGEIEEVVSTTLALPAGTQAKANDNYVPTVAIEYFFSPNFSVETIAGVTQHDVDGAGGLPATAELVSDAKIVPATLTFKAHANLGPVKPYIGVGPSLYLFIDEQPGAAMVGFGATNLKISNTVGVAFQAGADVPLTKSIFFSVDAKQYILRPTATWTNAADATILETKHKLDPLVVSVGLGLKF